MGVGGSRLNGNRESAVRRRIVYLLAAAGCFLAVFIGIRQVRTVSFPKDEASGEEGFTDGETSVSYRYDLVFTRVLLQYSDFRNLYRADYSTAIPGLENTDFGDSESGQMVPQGLCIAGEYMLVTAYDKSRREKSVIYVLFNGDASSRELLTTIVLPEKNHVGGITWDGSSFWVARSTTRSLGRISGNRIGAAVQAGEEICELDCYDEEVACGVTASFVACQDGRLWVGTSHSLFRDQGRLSVFLLQEGESGTVLQRQFTMEIPDYAQGLSFFCENGVQYLLLSASVGWFGDSHLYLYEEEINDEVVTLYPVAEYTLPPMAEEVAGDGAFTYCLFESAATCYSTAEGLACPWPVDRICALSNRRLIQY